MMLKHALAKRHAPNLSTYAHKRTHAPTHPRTHVRMHTRTLVLHLLCMLRPRAMRHNLCVCACVWQMVDAFMSVRPMPSMFD